MCDKMATVKYIETGSPKGSLNMLRLFICERDSKQRKHMETLVSDHIALHNYDMTIALSADNLAPILDYLNAYAIERGLYILDVNTESILIASKIKRYDPHGKIVFVSACPEALHLIFKHRIEALDYIIKDSPENLTTEIKKCVDVAYERLRL